MGFWLKGKLGRAWIGACGGAWVYRWVHGVMVLGGGLKMPVNQNPILNPAEEYPFGLHYTAAM